MLFPWIKICLFVVVITAPLLGLALFGAVGPYGNVARHPEYPTIRELRGMQPGALDRLANAALARSVVRRTSIELKNVVNADVVRFVDTPMIVSGTGDWLFLKAELWRKCLDEETLRPAIADLDLILDLGQASGLDIVASMSPDKAAIYPGRLHPFARRYWRCKAAGSSLLRRLLAEEAPQVIDHTIPILRGRQRFPGHQLYYRTDTHWTPLGGALALRQLLHRVFPNAAPSPEPRLTGEIALTDTDLRNGMLLLKDLEEKELLDMRIETELAQINDDPPARKTTVLGDSFYERLRGDLARIFPDYAYVSLEGDPKRFAAPIASADRLIINSVERLVPARASKGVLSPSGPIAEQILKRNMARAAACADFAAQNTKREADARTVSVSLPPHVSQQLHCLRVDIVAKEPGTVLLHFSISGNGAPGVGRDLPIAASTGRQAITIVVPARYAGGAIHVRGTADIAVDKIELGTLAPLPPVGATGSAR